MFELDWAKLLIIMVVAIVVVGPKELPGVLRTLGRTLATLRRHAEQFRAQFEQSLNEITRDAGVEDIRNDLRKLGELHPANQIRDTIDQAMRNVPSAQSYLKGEPVAGAVAAGPAVAGAAAVGAAVDAFEAGAPETSPIPAQNVSAQNGVSEEVKVAPQPEVGPAAPVHEPAPIVNKEAHEQATVY